MFDPLNQLTYRCPKFIHADGTSTEVIAMPSAGVIIAVRIPKINGEMMVAT